MRWNVECTRNRNWKMAQIFKPKKFEKILVLITEELIKGVEMMR